MRFSLMTLAIATFCLTLAACGGKEAPAPAAGGEAAKAEPAKKAGEWAEIKLDKLGLKAMAPGDAKLSALGGVSAMGGKCTAMVNAVSNMSPSFENTVKNVEKGHKGGPLKAFTNKVKTDDSNWVVDWTTDKKWGYASRKMIGDKAFSCGRVSASADAHACAVKVCESLTAL